MTIIKYLGPSDSVEVAPYGTHDLGREKEYPDEFAADLLETSNNQQFEEVDDGGTITKTGKDPQDMTVSELSDLLAALGIDIPARAKKADLISLLEKHTADPPKGDE